jgi:transcription antitermination factor NusG
MMAQLKVGDFAGFIERPIERPSIEPLHWYMLRVVPNRELKIEEKLRERDFDVYVPKERESRKTGWNRRSLRTVAIFEGSIFIPEHQADLRVLKNIADGIIGYCRFGQEPLVVRRKAMLEIRHFEELMDVPPSQRKRAFAVGQRVSIKTGPWAMWMAQVERLDRKQRLTASINLFGRMTSIELLEDQVEAV